MLNFLVIIFFSACQKKEKTWNDLLTKDERLDIEYFLKFLLFENYGAFVLFGNKPLCEMQLVDSVVAEEEEKKFFSRMTQEEQEELEAAKKQGFCFDVQFERNPYKGWEVLNRAKDQFNHSYILALHPLESYPGVYSCFLVNVEKTISVMTENYDIFKKAVGMDFDPQQIVYEIENPHSIFWQRVFELKNHTAKGLLFGFGKENAKAFRKELLTNTTLFPSTEEEISFGTGDPDHFTIPRFGALQGDELVEKYKMEKKEIEKIYQEHDLVEVTLSRLTHQSKKAV